MKSLSLALLAVQADAPALQKDSINPHFKNKYVSLESLMTQVLPVVNGHGIVVVQTPTTINDQPALRTRLIHAESGEELEDTMLLVLAKEDPQGQGSAITYARRYSLMAALGLVADEDDDGNSASRRRQRPARQAADGASSPALSAAAKPATDAQHAKLNALLKELDVKRPPQPSEPAWIEELKQWSIGQGFPPSRQKWSSEQMSKAIDEVALWEVPF